MSANAHRYSPSKDTARRRERAPQTRIELPKVRRVPDTERLAMPLLDRLLLAEQQRHADRLAEIRAIATQLPDLDPIVQATQTQGASIDIELVRQTYLGQRDDICRASHAVQLCAVQPALTAWRKPERENAIANALIRAGWRVVQVMTSGHEISLDRITLARGSRAVETTVMRQWVEDAIEAGLITADTAGRHPAIDTAVPLNAPRVD
ncbi:MAG: hypothetical protein GAK30_01553 [Paracidovorax wautersii]|uniref:Uncharacterized protein n=1 Tax=Paracidovorax wautersii TaxID=1177982 RepID=A0A7V8JQZ0_9BURK|nr:MAG: hypothetical protein GAK30_01553 [Paracidovorax wautersii]